MKDFIGELMATLSGVQGQFLAFMMGLLIILITIDVITGWSKGIYTGNLDSAKNFRGYIRKTTLVLLAFLGIILDVAVSAVLIFLGAADVSFMGLNFVNAPIIGGILLVWLSLGEVLSILENMSVLGVRMPKFLEDAVKRINNNIDKGEVDIKSVVKKDNEGKTVIQNTMKIKNKKE